MPAPIAVPEDQLIAADDPRMLELWGKIAKESINNGAPDHYRKIVERLNGPSIAHLRDVGVLGGKTHWRVFSYIDFETPLGDHGQVADSYDGAELRKAILAYLESKTDDELRGSAVTDSHRITWDR